MNLLDTLKLSGLFCLTVFSCAYAETGKATKSARTDLFDNPFVVIAENPKNRMVTGYLAALRTSPGRTDECKFVFQGKPARDGMSELLVADATAPLSIARPSPEAFASGLLKQSRKSATIVVSHADAPGNCDWILGFIGEPAVLEKGKQFEIRSTLDEDGSWTGVSVVRAKRAYFHGHPNTASKEKSFVVAGDLIYIYDETSDWYYVKYQNGKKETVGWIKKADTIQFPER